MTDRLKAWLDEREEVYARNRIEEPEWLRALRAVVELRDNDGKAPMTRHRFYAGYHDALEDAVRVIEKEVLGD